jgi:Zn-finger domain-containing protein
LEVVLLVGDSGDRAMSRPSFEYRWLNVEKIEVLSRSELEGVVKSEEIEIDVAGDNRWCDNKKKVSNIGNKVKQRREQL